MPLPNDQYLPVYAYLSFHVDMTAVKLPREDMNIAYMAAICIENSPSSVHLLTRERARPCG
jgi:hypothetical protein